LWKIPPNLAKFSVQLTYMRIAVFIKSTSFHAGFGGLETQNLVLCEGLVKAGNEVTVFSPQRELKIENSDLNGVKYVFVECVNRTLFSFINRESWLNKSYKSFLELHKVQPFNIVLSQSSAGIGVIKRKKEVGVKVVSVSHGSILSEFKTRISDVSSVSDWVSIVKDLVFVLTIFFGRQRDFILNSDKIIAVSNFVKKAIIDETYVSEERVKVIYNGIDPSSFSSEYINRDNNCVSILYVGRVIKSKGIDIILESLSKTKDVDFFLNIVGDGNFTDTAKKLAEKLGISQEVKFHGKLEFSEIVRLLYRSDIFVMPTKRVEGFPMTMVEAMFSGIPIIATKIGGVSEAVWDEETGFLVDTPNASDLLRMLEVLINDKKLREEFGRNALNRAQNLFSAGKMVEKYESVFREVLNENS